MTISWLQRKLIKSLYGHPTDLQTHYAAGVEAIFPIIRNPSLCDGLSLPSLKKNLKLHAEANPSISLSGNQEELRERLRNVLVTMEADAHVQKLLIK